MNPRKVGGSSQVGAEKKLVVVGVLLELLATCTEEEVLFDMVNGLKKYSKV